MPAQSNVERTLGIILGKLEALDDRLERADKSRENLHQRLDALVIRTTHLEADLFAVKNQTSTMKLVTDDVSTLRLKAEGAGSAGRFLIRIGIAIVTFAGWLFGIYTYVTGRPPP